MTLLILGLILWSGSHLLKRVAPGLRASLGDNGGKMLVTALSLLAIVLMVIGYRGADVITVWNPPVFLRHINNLLMVIAVILLNMGHSRGVMQTWLRHPMLTAVKTWALAHLLVRGDLASIILFGGLLAWAVVTVILINRQQRGWVRPAKGPVVNDVIYLVVSAVVFGVIVAIHGWLGYWPLG